MHRFFPFAALLLGCLLVAGPAAAQADDDGSVRAASEDADREALTREVLAPQAEASEPVRIWFYVDGDGQMHFVDSLDLVPTRYRRQARATTLGSPVPSASSREASETSGTEPDRADPAAGRGATLPSRSEQLEQLRGERLAILDELGALDEGWSELSDDGQEPTNEVLDFRAGQLLQRLEELDRRISGLETSRR